MVFKSRGVLLSKTYLVPTESCWKGRLVGEKVKSWSHNKHNLIPNWSNPDLNLFCWQGQSNCQTPSYTDNNLGNCKKLRRKFSGPKMIIFSYFPIPIWVLVLCGLNSVCCITGKWGGVELGPPTYHIQSLSKETEQKLGPCVLHLSAHLELSLPSKEWYFMLCFLCINWTGLPPHGALSKPQKSRPIQHELCLRQLSTRCVTQNGEKI